MRLTDGSGATPKERPTLTAVALPTEHGGWGLTAEPGILGLLVAPTAAGVCLALAAIVAFVARTPLKLVLVDRWRHRRLPRTALATKVAVVEVAALAGLVAAAFVLADHAFFAPALVAAPMVALELWFDMRSRSRRLVPELAGAIGVSATAPMIALADGTSGRIAAGLWLVLAGRVVSAIPFVRAQISRVHGRAARARDTVLADVVALATAGAAVACDRALLAGAIAVAVMITVQRATATRAVPRPAVLGAWQSALGLGVVLTTALGVLAP